MIQQINNLQETFNGFLLIDKPTGITSAYTLDKLKKVLGFKTKVGHAGTLDMFATGLLIVGIGRPATRLLSQAMQMDKTYVATAKLGQITNTLDIMGTVLAENDVSNITQKDIEDAIASLGTEYEQIPPIYSALKVGGKNLSYHAQKKELSEEELASIAELKKRLVHIYSCKLITYKPPFFTIEAHVSHGTYIRSFMNDIAQKLNGVGATTHALRRTTIGPFSVEQALPLAEYSSFDVIRQKLISIAEFSNRVLI